MKSGSARKVAGTHRRFGWIPDLPDHRDHLYAAPFHRLGVLPEKVDLRSNCPEIYDQGALGSCTANALAGALEFDQIRQKQKDVFTPSRLFIYYNERALEHSVDYDSGAQLRDGIKSVSKQGACSEKIWPYVISKFRSKPAARCYDLASHHRAILYQRLQPDLPQMKGCLAEGYPFVFGFSVYESFMSDVVAHTGKVPMPRQGEPGAGENGGPAGHAVMAVGYDDAEQRFIVRNSWGIGWGMKGYCAMPYAYLIQRNLAADFWTIRAIE